jgi:RNA polymerase sigma-70 factor (ECF subfamily)
VAAGGAADRLEPGPVAGPFDSPVGGDADANARANGREVTSMPTTTDTAASIHERFEATALPLHDSIYRANLRMTGDPVMAQDLTQETYLRAFRAFDSFEAGTNCRAWMLQISHNLFCRDYRGRKRITYRTAADDDVDVLAQFRADVPNPEEEALRQLDREALRRAIDKLPEPYRVAVTLVELQGLSCEEAAAVMGTPKGTVLSRLFRARERLRRLLLSEFGRARTRVPISAHNS